MEKVLGLLGLQLVWHSRLTTTWCNPKIISLERDGFRVRLICLHMPRVQQEITKARQIQFVVVTEEAQQFIGKMDQQIILEQDYLDVEEDVWEDSTTLVHWELGYEAKYEYSSGKSVDGDP